MAKKERVSNRLIIPFNAIFPEEHMESLDYYFQGISKEKLLKIGAHFLGFRNIGSAHEHPFTFLDNFFSIENENLVSEIKNKLITYIEDSPYDLADYSFLYVLSSLRFFEFIFDHIKETSDWIPETEMEINLFKALIMLNQINVENVGTISDEDLQLIPLEIRPSWLLLQMTLHNNDLINYSYDKLISTQIIRAIKFFEFLETREDCTKLLDEFYKFYSVNNFKEYLKNLMPFVKGIIGQTSESYIDFIVPQNESRKKNIEFIEKIASSDIDILTDEDFKSIRSKPFYKIGAGIYRVIFPVFVIELVYYGLYWKLKKINDTIPIHKNVKDLYNLKTLEFSEKYILSNLLDKIYDKKYLKKSGKELDQLYKSAPDYYIRNGKKIMLFESKDILINAEIKHSSDFTKIENELKIKLYKNQKGKPKAILQLINNIRKILTQTLEFDNGYKAINVLICPLIIVHNSIFNIAGLNSILNNWFQVELFKLTEEGICVKNVRPLIITDIDTLIFNQDPLIENQLDLWKCFIEYQDNCLDFSGKGNKYNSEEEAVKAQRNALAPFSSYLDLKSDNFKKQKTPRELRDSIMKILA